MSDNSDKNLVLRGQTWWIRAYVKGKLIQRSLHTSDVKVARAERDKKLEEAAGWAYRGNSVVTWDDATAEWIDHEGKHLPENTRKRYSVSLKQVEPYLSGLNIAAINNKVIGEFTRARRKQGVTATTIRRDLTAISKVLDYAIAEDWREDNPTLSRRRLIKERRDPIMLPHEDDIASVLASASPEFRALIVAAHLTGCRQNELVTARWRDYDAERMTLSVVGKKCKGRVISLRPIPSKDATAFFAALPRRFGSDLIFTKANGQPFSQAASDFTHVRRAAEMKAKRSGERFRRFRFHDLRHLFAVEALRDGMNIYDLQQHMGHSSVKVTEIYLAHLTTEEAAKAKGGASHVQNYIRRA
jgi:integrase/recombinase XerD